VKDMSEEREKSKEKALSCIVQNRDKIVVAVGEGKEWFSEIQEETHIKSLNYFRDALCCAKRDGFIIEIKSGKYCISKEELK